MALLSVRDKCIKRSGRYDLGTITEGSTAGTDAGMNWYINEGLKMLERRFTNMQSRAKRVGVLAVGEYLKIFPQARVIEDVWLIDSAGESFPVIRKEYQQIRDYYNERLSVMDNGTPAYWAPASVKIDPNLTIDEATFAIDDMDELVLSNTLGANGIVFAPPTDTEYTIEILGKFYSSPLSNDLDTNLWTENYEGLLIRAAMYQIELDHRNTEGARDWLAGIDNEIIGIDMDEVMFDTEEINEMEG